MVESYARVCMDWLLDLFDCDWSIFTFFTTRSDFIRLGGFHGDTSFGWGGEDVYLYRKFIRSTIRVVRAPDPALFHLWHPKKCNKELGPVQHQSCLRSRAFSEASHDQLGLLLYEKFFNESDWLYVQCDSIKSTAISVFISIFIIKLHFCFWIESVIDRQQLVKLMMLDIIDKLGMAF